MPQEAVAWAEGAVSSKREDVDVVHLCGTKGDQRTLHPDVGRVALVGKVRIDGLWLSIHSHRVCPCLDAIVHHLVHLGEDLAVGAVVNQGGVELRLCDMVLAEHGLHEYVLVLFAVSAHVLCHSLCQMVVHEDVLHLSLRHYALRFAGFAGNQAKHQERRKR